MTRDEALVRLTNLARRAYPGGVPAAVGEDEWREAFEEMFQPHPRWLEAIFAALQSLAMPSSELARLQAVKQLCQRAIALRAAALQKPETQSDYDNALAELHALLTPETVLALLSEWIEVA